MTIHINQIAVDFTLEKEKTFADLTTALRAWATAQNLAVLGMLADGKALGPDDATPLSNLHVIDVEAVPAGERDLARVAVLARFFALLAQGWESPDSGLVEELQGEYPSVRNALFPLLDSLAARLQPPLAVLDQPWTPGAALAEACGQIAREVENRRFELQSPGRALAQSLEALEAKAARLGDLGSLFQQGQDKDAFSLILGLFTVLEDTNRRAELYLRDQAGPVESWQEFHNELQPFLREAEQALGSGDYILLTDLLEYEITPRLTGVKMLFPGISNLDPVPDLL